MHRVQALALPLAAASRLDALELARKAIVVGCAFVLILAGRALPF